MQKKVANISSTHDIRISMSGRHKSIHWKLEEIIYNAISGRI